MCEINVPAGINVPLGEFYKDNKRAPLENLIETQVRAQYYSRAVSPYGIFIVCTDHPVMVAWQQYRPIVPVSSAETASYKLRRV